MEQLNPIIVVELFPEERRQLLELFSGLAEAEWNRPTVCEGWSVKDVGLHILGDDLGYLSRERDHFADRGEIGGGVPDWASLVRALDAVNQAWVASTRRISPRMLQDLLLLTGQQFYDYVRALDQMHMGGPVSWAGPGPAPIWLDIAREYTERWLHQQHIRDAVTKPGLKNKKLFPPVIDTFMRALPHTYRDVSFPDHTVAKIVVTGDCGGTWYLQREGGKWLLCRSADFSPSATVTIDQETYWRLVTKGIGKADAATRATIEGNRELGEKVLDTVSIIA